MVQNPLRFGSGARKYINNSHKERYLLHWNSVYEFSLFLTNNKLHLFTHSNIKIFLDLPACGDI
jgi:hypothetical protein